MFKICGLLLICYITFYKINGQEYTINKNPIRYPYGDCFMGLFVALALPLEVNNYDLFVSHNFEGNYVLPTNQTEWNYPPIVTRSLHIARKLVYDAFEYKLKSHGMPGKSCLLRAICEAAEYSLQHNGVLSDIVHIMLTPSTSKNEGLSDYEKAETYGKLYKHCKKYKKKCSISVLDIISQISHMIE